MSVNTNIISDEICFYSKRTISSISKYKECLDKFSKDFDKEISLKTDTIIFLDTNVLLRYYSISFTARAKLFEFLIENQKRIFVTPQVQTEYLRNREDIIQRFHDQVTSKIPKDFSTDIVNKMKNFLDQHKTVLKDYPFVEPGIEKYRADLEALLKKLNDAVDLKKKEHIELVFKDQLLDYLSECNQAEKLLDDELKLIKEQFDTLSKNLNPELIDSLINKPNGAFPGLGDIKNKPEDPHGDYIIFHEIMKYMILREVDAIFLTFDNTKGDWMTKSKSPYLHYVQNMFANTGQILYICDADRAFGELLNIDIESLVSSKTKSPEAITADSLLQFTRTSRVFNGAKEIRFGTGFLDELSLNGYTNMYQIENHIQSVEDKILKYREERKNLNIIGVMRCGLRIANRDYTLEVTEDEGTANEISSERLARYKKYFDSN